MRKLLGKFASNQNGATAIEYGLIVAVLSLAIVAGVGQAGNGLEYLWANNNSKLADAFK